MLTSGALKGSYDCAENWIFELPHFWEVPPSKFLR